MQGNEEGAVNIKKQRTWRQYMNRCVRFSQVPVKQLTNVFVGVAGSIGLLTKSNNLSLVCVHIYMIFILMQLKTRSQDLYVRTRLQWFERSFCCLCH